MYPSRARRLAPYNGTHIVQTNYGGDEVFGDDIVPSHTHELSPAPHVKRLQPSGADFGESPGF